MIKITLLPEHAQGDFSITTDCSMARASEQHFKQICSAGTSGISILDDKSGEAKRFKITSIKAFNGEDEVQRRGARSQDYNYNQTNWRHYDHDNLRNGVYTHAVIKIKEVPIN